MGNINCEFLLNLKFFFKNNTRLKNKHECGHKILKNTYSLRKMYLTIILSTLKHIYRIMAIIMPFIDTKPIHDYKYKWFNRRGFRYGSVPKKIAPQKWSIRYFQCQSSQWFLIKHAHAYKSKRNPHALISQIIFGNTNKNAHTIISQTQI